MWSRQKVKKMKYTGNSKEVASYTAGKVDDKDKADQEYYEKKVNNLLSCCKQFEKSLNNIKSINEFTSDSVEWHFNKNFKNIMKKMFSKTSKILNGMDKKLKKFKKKPFIKDGELDTKLMFGIKDAFKYDEPEGKWSKDTIDRAAIYDKAVYDFFNDEKNPFQLQKTINNLASRAIEKTRKESQKNIAVWVGKKLGEIEIKIKKMNKALSYAEGLVQSSGNTLQGVNGFPPVPAAPPILPGGGIVVRQKTQEEIECEKKIQELGKQINANASDCEEIFKEMTKNETLMAMFRKYYVRWQSEKAREEEKKGSSTSFPKYSINSKTITQLLAEKVNEVSEGDNFAAQALKKVASKKPKKEVYDLKVGDQFYSVGDFVEECRKELTKIENSFDSITDLIKGNSTAKDIKGIEELIDNLVASIETVWKNINGAVTDAKKLSENVGIIANESDKERKDRIAKIEGIYKNLVGMFNDLKSDKKKLEDYTQRMIVVNKEVAVGVIKEYKSVCGGAEKIIEGQEDGLKDISANNIGNEFKAIEQAMIAIGKAIPKSSDIEDLKGKIGIVNASLEADAELKNNPDDETLKDKANKAKEAKDKILDEKQNLRKSINAAIGGLKNKVVIARDLVGESKDEFDKSIDTNDELGQESKLKDKNISKWLKQIYDFLDNLNNSLASNKKVGKSLEIGNDNVAAVEAMLAQIDKDLVDMEKVLLMASGCNKEQLEAYNKGITDRKNSVRSMKDVFEKFKTAGENFEQASKEKFDEGKFNKIMNDYNTAREKLFNIEVFKKLKPKPNKSIINKINGVSGPGSLNSFAL